MLTMKYVGGVYNNMHTAFGVETEWQKQKLKFIVQSDAREKRKKNAAATVVCYSSIRNLIKTKQIGFLFRFIGSSARFTPFIRILNHWFISIRQHSFQDDGKTEMLHSTFLEQRSIIPENEQKPNDFHQIQWILEMSEIDTQPLRVARCQFSTRIFPSTEHRESNKLN